MTMNLDVYVCDVEEVGDFKCNWEGHSQFRLISDELRGIITVSPYFDFRSRYQVSVLFVPEPGVDLQPESIQVDLVAIDAAGAVRSLGLSLLGKPMYDEPGQISESNLPGSWMQDFNVQSPMKEEPKYRYELRLKLDYTREGSPDIIHLELNVPLKRERVAVPYTIV